MKSSKVICFGLVCLIACIALTDAQWFGSKKKKEEEPNVALLSYNPIDPDAVPPPQAPTTSTTSTTTPAPTTTKKKGFFGGLFGGGDKKEKEPKTTTTTTTTPKPTTTTKSTTVAPTTKKSSGFFGGLFGGKKDKTTTTVAPLTTAKAGVTVPTTTAKSAVATSTVKPGSSVTPVVGLTSTVKPGTPVSSSSIPTIPKTPTSQDAFRPLPPVPTTAASATKPPVPPKPVSPASPVLDAFPPLPPKAGSPTPASVPTSTVASAWNKPLPGQPPASPVAGKPGVSFVPTQPPVNGVRSTTPKFTEGSTATDEELEALSEQLFAKDNANLNKHVRANYQRQTLSSSTVDEASDPLLTIDEQQVFSYPTIEKMRPLFNNYEIDTMVNEHVTAMEKKEENDFVDALLATNVMRTAMLFLQKKGVVTADPKTHHELLKTIWFQLYSRGNGKIGSSGFEHVFLNEISNGTMIGLHNWVYLYEQEKAGRLDYQGYLKKMDLSNKGEIAKVRLTFDKLHKPSNSLFIATSPELEIALYTVCFHMRQDTECPLSYNGKKFTIKTFSFRYRGKNLIGGAWPNF
ncbi:endoribonuclease CG2145 [Toxorhynchites rutilus septentrionalis]|uniref:endoribonuclease CG2145 n=1 Tax=Toxorhynchites rutilus septentrionalis TaxID=329112 RepID=UPI00247A8D7B|nr:endoribonuclease CG2145 [Toxorhynchites rutilus septentrionalis]